MKQLIFIMTLSTTLFAENFLTQVEHGEKIYKETRGVACASCHGLYNEGKIILTTKDKKRERKILAPALKELSFNSLKNGIKNHKFAPPYYLTDYELEAMLAYLNDN